MNAPDMFQIDPVISALYEATLEPERWRDALQAMARLSGAQAAVFVDMDYALSVLWRHVLHNVDEEAHLTYLQRYAQIDPRLPVMMKAPELRWVSDLEALPDAIRLESPVYRDYLRPAGLRECLMAKTAVEGARHGNLVLLRMGVEDVFSAEQRQLLGLLLPHVDRAIRISRRLAAFAWALAFGGRGVEEYADPVATLTERGDISEANPAFEALLKSQSLFRTDGNKRLVCISSDAQRRFHQAFSDALELSKGNTRHGWRSMPVLTVERADGPPFLVTVAPLMQLQGHPWFERTGVLVKVSDPLRPPSGSVLQEGFGLTPAEARLACALLAGGTLKDAATRIGISPNTAKTQLQVVFQKTRTGRQQELVSLLRSIPH
jgi:DNA-binding CsgD family transcriptional regulator/PAS domain-containing protein